MIDAGILTALSAKAQRLREIGEHHPGDRGPTMRPTLNTMALTPSALVTSAGSSTMTRTSVWRTGISKRRWPIADDGGDDEIDGDIGDARGAQHRQQRGAGCEEEVDGDQHL